MEKQVALAASEGGWDKISSVMLPKYLYPKKTTERLAYRLLLDFGVEFDFFKNPVEPSAYLDGSPSEKADLRFKTRLDETSHVQLNLEDDLSFLRVTTSDLHADPKKDWTSTGAIASVLDLYGSQVLLDFRYDDWDDSDDAIFKVMQESEIDYVDLKIGEHEVRLQHLQPSHGSRRVYSMILSDTAFPGLRLFIPPSQSRTAQDR